MIACIRLVQAAVVVVCGLAVIGCEGDYAVPITAGPTRKIDHRLLGNWTSKDGNDKVIVRSYDASNYILSVDGDLYRAFHSDVGGTNFISAQEIDTAERKYSYVSYRLSPNGKVLYVRVVNTKMIPKTTRSSVSVQRLLTTNLRNSALFDDEVEFSKKED